MVVFSIEKPLNPLISALVCCFVWFNSFCCRWYYL